MSAKERPRPRRWPAGVGGAFVAVAIALGGGATVGAHEIGTTRVVVSFHEDRQYDIDVITDAAALVDKLERVAGVPTAERDAWHLRARLSSFDTLVRQRVHVTFDEIEAPSPDITYAVAPPIDELSAPAATIRLHGSIPADARQFTWSYGWTFSSYALSVADPGAANTSTEWLEGSQTSTPRALGAPPPPADRLATARRYLVLGFTHILPYGLDHMLFVLGIYLLSRRVRSVMWQVSAFTVAHSITLGLSMYGLVSVPSSIVEPLIAVSIAYVALENVFLSDLRSWRVALVFGFGLLHGMGFAGALSEIGLPRGEFVTALVTFNAGVEAGQLAVIGAAFLLVGHHCAHRVWYRSRVVVPASLLIACIAMYWTVERLS